MKFIYIYTVEGYEYHDAKTDTYYQVRRIEVITDSEKNAIAEAKKLVKCKNYIVTGCFQKVITSEFSDEEKTYLFQHLESIAGK